MFPSVNPPPNTKPNARVEDRDNRVVEGPQCLQNTRLMRKEASVQSGPSSR
jgi:hypothetical protein